MQQLITDEIARQDAQLGENGEGGDETKPNSEAADEQNNDNRSTGSSSSSSNDDPTQCNPGYIYKPRTGRGCVQENCNSESIPNAHYSYTGDCICGSAGSINENPDDPNTPCRYDKSFSDCPNCVYACVHAKEECPEAP